ncbi:MAG: hypothetical protein AB7O26_16700 [Planctomycetaceae bacterium]
MSNDQWNQDPDGNSFDPQYSEERYQAPKPGMSTGVKILIALVVLFGGGVLVCCGGFAYFTYMFMPQIETTPAAINAVRDEIVTITLPPELEPESAIKMDNFIMSFKTAHYESKDDKSSFSIDEINAKMGDAPPDQDVQLRDAMEKQGQRRPIKADESSVKKLKVKGADVDFTFSKGVDSATGKKKRQVTGSFPGKGGKASLTYQADEESYKEDDVIKMIESIQ